MFIHKSHSKTDIIDLINNLGLKVVFSHQDNKKDIHDKINDFINNNKELNFDNNFYNIQSKDGLISYLQNINPKKTLTIKEKNNVMLICKRIIQYCKNNYEFDFAQYDSLQDLQDDMDYVKQFGDIPSVRRCCRLMNEDPKFGGIKFIPFISPQVKKDLDDKKITKTNHYYKLAIRRSTPEEPIIVYFD